MEFNWSFNIANVLTIGTLVVGGILLVNTLKERVESISKRLGALEDELKRLVDVLIHQGRQDERMTAMDARLVNQGARLDEIINRYNTSSDQLHNK